MTDELERLTAAEFDTLAAHEATIEAGLQTFYDVGVALIAIREQRLYRQWHASFEAYTHARWGITAGRARQLIGAVEVVESVTRVTPTGAPTGMPAPQSEAQARALRKAPEHARAAIWQEVVRRHGSGATARQVGQVVQELTGAAAAPAPGAAAAPAPGAAAAPAPGAAAAPALGATNANYAILLEERNRLQIALDTTTRENAALRAQIARLEGENERLYKRLSKVMA